MADNTIHDDGRAGKHNPREIRNEYVKRTEPFGYVGYLLQQHLDLIIASAIAPAVSAERGYRTEETKSHIKALGFGGAQTNAPALLIPLYNVLGSAAGYQSRPDGPRQNKDGKPVKYETPRGLSMLIDAHPRLTAKRAYTEFDPQNIPSRIADPAEPLLITEGVRKGDCLVSLGLCCVALLGVWNFRGKNELGGYTALPDWDHIALKGRDVYVVYDNDVIIKPSVYKSLARLKAILEFAGAHVHVIYLPSGDGAKVGVDDWVAAKKRDGLDDESIRTELFSLAVDELRQPPTDPSTGDRPAVVVRGGQLPWLVDRAQEVIAQQHDRWRIYERTGNRALTDIHVDPVEREERSTQIHRPAGAVTLKPLTCPMAEDLLTRALDWRKYRERERDEVPIDCPRKIAEVFLSRAGNRQLPPLVGVIEAPILRPDGTVLSEPGYDPATGLFLYSDQQWLSVPDEPTFDDLVVAAETLRNPLAEFPFIGESDRTVVLSGILTGIQRRLLPSAPLHGLDAPLQGYGKSLLADVISIVATGRPAVVVSAAKDTDEMRKRFVSILLAGDLVINIDNITRPLESDALSSILTQEVYTDRVLGVLSTTSTPTNSLWLGTGNNLSFSGDMPSRVIVARLDAGVERPEERTFDVPKLRKHVLENRPQLVKAALTVLRAHHLNRPKLGLKAFGRFEAWSDQIRTALVWVGFADPCLTRERVVTDDPERDQVAAVLTAWYDVEAEKAVTLRGVIKDAELNDTLKAALVDVAVNAKTPGVIDPTRLSWWCRGHVDRVVEGLRLTKLEKDKHNKLQLWAVKVAVVAVVRGSSPSPNAGRWQEDGQHSNCHSPEAGLGEPPRTTATTAESASEVTEDYEIDRLAEQDKDWTDVE